MNKGFERGPRTLLEIGVFAGGLVVPLLCVYARLALFLPAAALLPTALFASLFKLAGLLGEYHAMSFGVAARPSEAVEFYLYFFTWPI